MATDQETPPPRRRKKTSSKQSTQQSGSASGDGLDEVVAGFGSNDPSAGSTSAAGYDDGVDYTGTPITVTWGKEHVQPIRFQGMDIGTFSMTVTVIYGETPVQAKRRAMVHLNAMAEEEADEKMPRFIARCRKAEREATI